MTAGSDFVGYLLSAGGVVAVFLLIAVGSLLSTSSRRPQRVLVAAALAFTLLSVYGVQSLVTNVLSGSFKPFDASQLRADGPTAVVVLGSGSLTAEDWDGRTFSFVDRTAAVRVAETVRVFRLVDPPVVISSGGEPHESRRGAPTGETMKDALVASGVPRDRIVVETQSKTTREEALIVAPMLAARGIRQVVLVTSGTHMARSLGTFRALGIAVVPAVAHERAADFPRLLVFVPSKEGLGLASENAHEMLGLVYYWLRGWWTR